MTSGLVSQHQRLLREAAPCRRRWPRRLSSVFRAGSDAGKSLALAAGDRERRRLLGAEVVRGPAAVHDARADLGDQRGELAAGEELLHHRGPGQARAELLGPVSQAGLVGLAVERGAEQGQDLGVVAVAQAGVLRGGEDRLAEPGQAAGGAPVLGEVADRALPAWLIGDAPETLGVLLGDELGLARTPATRSPRLPPGWPRGPPRARLAGPRPPCPCPSSGASSSPRSSYTQGSRRKADRERHGSGTSAPG